MDTSVGCIKITLSHEAHKNFCSFPYPRVKYIEEKKFLINSNKWSRNVTLNLVLRLFWLQTRSCSERAKCEITRLQCVTSTRFKNKKCEFSLYLEFLQDKFTDFSQVFMAPRAGLQQHTLIFPTVFITRSADLALGPIHYTGRLTHYETN